MTNANQQSNANPWELEIVCKDRKSLNTVVISILDVGTINFEVVNIESYGTETFDGRYTVMMWGVWYGALLEMTKLLASLEEM